MSNPQPTVAIVGASADRSKYGNRSVLAHLAKGYRVFPVNPKGGTLAGLPVYARVADLPVDTVDRITVYVPPHIGIALLPEFVEKHPREVWFNPGSESDELLAAAEKLGLPVIAACSIVDLAHRPTV